MKRTPVYPVTVFYDRSCPLCREEMHALKRLDARARLELVDCSAPDFNDDFLVGDGLGREDLMRRIHARDIRGRWFVGADAFEVIYGAAGLERAARLWGSARLRPVLDKAYPWVARHRQLLSRLGLGRLVGRLIPKPATPRKAQPGSRSV